MSGDILEIELQLLKDKSTKSIETTLKNGEEIVLYSPYYVKLLETENKQLQQENKQLKSILTELEEWLKEENTYSDYKDITYRETMGYVLDKIQELKEEV